MNRIPRGLALLPRPQLRHRLHVDTRHWLNKGNRIRQLPPGRARGLGRYEYLTDLLVDTGLHCEY